MSGNLPYIDLAEFVPSQAAVEQISSDMAIRMQVLPVAFDESMSRLVLARGSEPGLPIKDSLKRSVDDSVNIKWMLADPALMPMAIEKSYAREHDLFEIINACQRGEPNKVFIPDLVDALLCHAADRRASDIHLSATDNALDLKLRIDGVMERVGSLPVRLHEALIVRFKVISELDIAETRRPQDGQFRRTINGCTFEYRVSTFPTCRGENIVLRQLTQDQRHRSLKELGFPLEFVQRLSRLAHQPSGMIIVCGPTGSGKSSTLFSLLSERDIETLNVMSLENPVEIRVAGVQQSNVDSERGLDFAAGVRALLRQDPDILLIGEMRDAESAAMAFRAAMTGHLVLTTVHASDAIATIDRLRELGISAEVLSSTVRGIVAQRLLRVNCTCRTINNAGEVNVDCPTCYGSGYFGRQAIAEVLEITPEVIAFINTPCLSQKLIDCAESQGFRRLRDSAEQLVRDGRTSTDEVNRVLGTEVLT